MSGADTCTMQRESCMHVYVCVWVLCAWVCAREGVTNPKEQHLVQPYTTLALRLTCTTHPEGASSMALCLWLITPTANMKAKIRLADGAHSAATVHAVWQQCEQYRATA
eukprot:1160568-Pelagomonas_calceolata.AAC.11